MPAMPPVAPVIVPLPNSPVQSPNVPVTPQITDPTYDSVMVDTSYTPRGSLLSYVDGANWTVDWYSQLIGSTMELSALNADRPGSIQQYRRIHNYVLKVTSPWSPSQDDSSKSMIGQGTATSMPGVIINVGDEFVADIGDGRLGVFVVSTSEKKTLLRDSVYSFNYTLKCYASADKLDELNQKVVQDTTYVQANLLTGNSPLVATPNVLVLQELTEIRPLLVAQYFQRFFSVEYQTLLVPGQTEATYDPWAVQAIRDYMPEEMIHYVPKLTFLNVDGDEAFRVKSLWYVLDRMRYDHMPLINQRFGLAPITQVTSPWPYFGSAFFSTIPYIMYPIDARMDIDRQYVSNNQPTVSPLSEGMPATLDISRLIATTSLSGFPYPNGTSALPDILPVTVDDYYVFSEGFYSLPAQASSKLEQITLAAIQGQTIDPGALYDLATKAMQWGELEKYYYIPVLLALINCQLGNS